MRLKEVAEVGGAQRAYRIDKALEMEADWFEGVETVGLTSGASVPEALVKEVLAQLAQWGFTEVEEVETAQETVTFALPLPLRKELKEAGMITTDNRRRTNDPGHTC